MWVTVVHLFGSGLTGRDDLDVESQFDASQGVVTVHRDIIALDRGDSDTPQLAILALGLEHHAGLYLVDALERNRFDSLWLSERIGGDCPDPLVGMSYAMGRTTKLKVGMSVMVLPGRNPVVLAKSMASLDRQQDRSPVGVIGHITGQPDCIKDRDPVIGDAVGGGVVYFSNNSKLKIEVAPASDIDIIIGKKL